MLKYNTPKKFVEKALERAKLEQNLCQKARILDRLLKLIESGVIKEVDLPADVKRGDLNGIKNALEALHAKLQSF